MTPAVPPPFLVLAADEPERLAAFYGALLQSTPLVGSSARHWRLLGPGEGRLEIYAPSRQRPRPRGEGRLALCFSRPAGALPPLQVLHDWHAAMLALGAVAVEPPRQEPFGAEAWLADPEGNRLLLLVSAG
ncbi:VOC family protein [Synechococcus sp. CS-1332]|uniref:VOC family protein n=1 Tax=Synechococcus sp. CS-1332 TaxID=2847972 RepID=UPI00223B1B9D|nr:VOC family protein [Synechococcus sp. CS-1332]MCT0206823.1 VOC family protein [Synechococcus sp. CS-1332]